MPRRVTRDVKIIEISGEGERVAVFGTVVLFDPQQGRGKIDDGTGVAEFILDDFLFAEKLAEKARVRIIGRAYKSDEGIIIRAEIVQDMEGVDPRIYEEVRSLERRVWHEGSI